MTPQTNLPPESPTAEAPGPCPEAQAYLTAQRDLLDAWRWWVEHKITSAQLEAAREKCDVADRALRTANEARDRENEKRKEGP